MIPGLSVRLNRFTAFAACALVVRAPDYHGPMPLRVAFIAAECEPWAKTGGLGDVVDALARALALVPGATDGLVDVFLPRYRSVPVPADTPPGTPLRVPDPSVVSAGPST